MEREFELDENGDVVEFYKPTFKYQLDYFYKCFRESKIDHILFEMDRYGITIDDLIEAKKEK